MATLSVRFDVTFSFFLLFCILFWFRFCSFLFPFPFFLCFVCHKYLLVVLLCCCTWTQWAAEIHTHTYRQGAKDCGGMLGQSPHICYCMVTCMGLCRCVTGVCGLWIQTKQTYTHIYTHTTHMYARIHTQADLYIRRWEHTHSLRHFNTH